MAIDQLLLFIAAGLLLNVTPGPDVLYIVTHALKWGAHAGIVAACGITAGCFVHIFAAAAGVSALLAAAWLSARVGAVRKGMHWLERAAGAMFLGFGLKLALSDNPQR